MATDDDTEVRFSLRLHDSTAKTAVPVKRSEQRMDSSVKRITLGCVVPAFPLGPEHPDTGSEPTRAENSHETLIKFEPSTSRSAFR